jgi:DNA-binding LacI/PurR family transcriptional regulator
MTMSRSAKLDGFHAAAETAGLRASTQVLDGGPLDEYGDAVIAEVGRALAGRIARAAHRPTGIVALNDLMALGLMAGLREAGLSVPNDVSVVGMDGHFLSALSNPALTTVQLPVPAMARAMVERAMHPHPDSNTAESKKIFAPTQLIERESVARPAAAARSRAARSGQEKART